MKPGLLFPRGWKVTQGTDDGELMSWIDQADHCISSLISAPASAKRTLQHEAQGDEVDQAALFHTAQEVRTWVSTHPSPVRAIDDRFGVLLARSDSAALTAETDVAVAIDRLRTLNAELTAFVADLSTRRAL